MQHNTQIYFVEGNISNGKSTFLKMIEENIPDCQVIYEPLNVWQNIIDSSNKNILDYFYTDMKKFAYSFQSLAFLSRVKSFQDVDYSKKYVFIERSIYSDKYIFAKNCYESGIMNEIEWNLYNEWFNWMEGMLNLNENRYKFVYISCEPNTSYNRLLLRNRREENTVSLEYLTQIYNKHEEWLNNKENVIKLDGNVSFNKDKNVFLNMFNKIINN
jgi:deoxyguanosine kinase